MVLKDTPMPMVIFGILQGANISILLVVEVIMLPLDGFITDENSNPTISYSSVLSLGLYVQGTPSSSVLAKWY